MRIYTDCKQLMSEAIRDVLEMGKIVKPQHYQNKDIHNDENYITKEVMNYQYCLTSMSNFGYLFLTDMRSQDWATEEFSERVHWNGGATYMNPGKAYLLRPDIWEPFLVNHLNRSGEPIHFDYTYNERFRHLIRGWDKNKVDTWTNNLDTLIQLLKEDPDTRKAVLPVFSLNDVRYVDGSRRIPCSMYYDFLVRPDAKGLLTVNINYHQRSSDIHTHFGNDVALAWKLMEYVAEKTGYQVGYLTHCIDSLHSYKKDWDSLRTLIGEMI